MKKTILISLLSLLSFASFTQPNTKEVFTFPAEFQTHEAICMDWKKFPAAADFKEETVLVVIKAN